MNWQEVFKVHRRIGAVYFEEGKLKSALFTTDTRRRRLNFRADNAIKLCFDPNSKAKEIGQIHKLLQIGDVFTVYEKLSPDRWIDAGLHKCIGIENGVDAIGRISLVVSAEPE